MNPGGSVKDRAGLYIITDAEKRGVLKPGGTIVEGTAGNTGIGLTLVGNARGYRCVIVMPETQSKEKIDFLRMIGADLRLVPAKPYRDPGNYVHVSRRMAEETGAVWANQFDNLANREGHRAQHRAGDLGADRRQGRRVHLLLRHRRHAGRRRVRAEGSAIRRCASCWRICEGSGLYGWVKQQRPDDRAAARSPRASATRASPPTWTARRSTTRSASPTPRRWSTSTTC